MNYASSKTITFTTPSAASTVVHTSTFQKMAKFKRVIIVGDLVGATGGTLDVYLQYKIVRNGTVAWVDWLHFVQLASGGAAARYVHDTAKLLGVAAPLAVGVGTTAAPGVALAAATLASDLGGDEVRIVCVAGVSTSAGASISITLIGREPQE